MNRILMKLLCLCLAVMMTLSSVAFAQEPVETAELLTEEVIISEEVSDGQEVYLHSEPLEAVYLEYTIGGEDMSSDTAVGDITYATNIPNALYEVVPSDANMYCGWQADGDIGDWGAKRLQVDGEWCAMIVKYFRKDRNSVAWANMPFALGSSFSEQHNQAVFEVDYYDNGTNSFEIIYMNTATEKTTSKVSVARTGTDTWKTASVLTGTDAHLYRNSNTGLGHGSTSPVRINQNGQVYVKAFRVYTPGYRELMALADSIAFDFDTSAVEESFTLPAPEGADSITWTSSDEDVIEIVDNTAYVFRTDYDNRECTLTARVVKDGYYMDKEFTLTAKAMYQDLNEAKDNLEITSVDTSNVTGSFELPTVDDKFTLVWTSSDETLVTVDGNTAVVTAKPFEAASCALTAKIYMGDRYVEKVFELHMPAQYKKAVFAEYIMGENLASDIAKGDIKYDVSEDDQVLTRVEPSAETNNLPLVALGITCDWAGMREQFDGRWAAVTGRYSRPKRAEKPTVNGNIPFDTNNTFTTDDNNVTVEVDYYDNASAGFSLYYKNTGDGARVTIPRTGTNTWLTYSVTLNDAYFVPGKTGMGVGGQTDFRFESSGNDIIIGAVRVYSPGYEVIADGADALVFDEPLTDITESFALPTVDGVEIYWTSSDESVVKIVDGMAIVYGDEEAEKECTITAKLASKGVYTEKNFAVHLAKKPKKAVITGKPVITKNGTLNTVSFELTDAGNLSGTNVTLILTAVDKATDEIKDMAVAYERIYGDIAEISASVNVSAGQELRYYLVDANGAPLYNMAPAAIGNYKGISKTTGAGFAWDYAKDDYFIKEYVVYDEAGNEYLRTEENSFVVPDVKEGQTYSFSVEGFDHEGISTGRTAVASAGLFVPSYCDLSAPMTDKSIFTDVYFCATSTVITGGDNYSEEVTKTDAVTGEVRTGRKSVNRTSVGKHNSFLYFRADRDNVDENVREVTMIVDYYDEGARRS